MAIVRTIGASIDNGACLAGELGWRSILIMSTPIVFLDTCVLKSAVRMKQFGKLTDIHNITGELVGRYVPIVDRNYNDDLRDLNYREECNLVESVAQLALDGSITAVTSPEVLLEFVRLPRTFPLSGGIFHGARYELVYPPIRLGYSLTVSKEELRGSLESINHHRYLEIRKRVGAFQGTMSVPINQLFDALFIWTAESAGCEYFLTVEQKLPAYGFESEKLECLRPSALLAKLSS